MLKSYELFVNNPKTKFSKSVSKHKASQPRPQGSFTADF